MKNLEDWAAVQKVYKQTKSKRATADILGISRNTVKKLLGLSEPPKYQRTDYGVAANLSCPETDVICCPKIAGHGVKKNDRV